MGCECSEAKISDIIKKFDQLDNENSGTISSIGQGDGKLQLHNFSRELDSLEAEAVKAAYNFSYSATDKTLTREELLKAVCEYDFDKNGSLSLMEITGMGLDKL